MRILSVSLPAGLMLSNSSLAQEPSFVGTWNIVVQVEQSSCKNLVGTEVPFQWNIGRAADGTYFVGKKEVADKRTQLPYTGRAKDGVLTLRGGQVELVYSQHLVSLPMVFELEKKGERLSGRVIGSMKPDSRKVNGATLHPVCAITGRVTSR
ncbi:MAG: hypothetical protein AAGA48_29940 [Myxococcota bacterium]